MRSDHSTTPTATRAEDPPSRDDPDGMTWVPGGRFRMGSADFYPEERSVCEVAVGGFWMETGPVTVAQFRRFVKQTGYVTTAERPPDRADYPDADPDLLVPGSLVFRKASGPVDLRDVRNWWAYLPGANWRHPDGPGSGLSRRDGHPVTHVAYADALAYVAWAGRELPTEAEWEYAARGGLDGAVFAWGDEFAPGAVPMANTWQGQFPWQNLLLDGFEGTSPVGAFPPNGYGLYDMTGNVWEWTSDLFRPRHRPASTEQAEPARPCCTPREVTAGDIPRRVIKGGSHLCAPNYCLRYRPAARQGEAVDTSTSHIGFRCVLRSQTSAPPPRGRERGTCR
jgi:formylglycine-generating enzyme required for sulfatase activity